MSFFASLPPELRRELRSQPSLESNNVTSGEGQEAAPQLSDLLPTQPPAQDGEAEGEGEDMDEDEDEDDDDDDKRAEDADMTEEAEANDSQIPPSTLPNGASSNTSAPARTAPPGASSSSTNTTTAVISRRHEYPPPPSSGRPAKRRRGEDPDPAASENPYLGHPWDCTGLVPRYMDRSEVPQNLQKCERPVPQH